MADVTTKLVFACYTNHCTTSEAKALLAVIAVKSKPHRTRVTQLCRFLQWLVSRCRRGHRGTAISRLRQPVAPWVNFCPSTCGGQGRNVGHGPGHLVLYALPEQVITGCWGVHTSYLATFLVSKRSKEITLPTRNWVWLFQASLSSTQKRCILLSMSCFLTKEFLCL